ncbi:MAG: hypothetical protein Q8R01_12195 [Ramlibacter sp.]|nr:hypothetical protein [Ramlibacter sp.]
MADALAAGPGFRPITEDRIFVLCPNNLVTGGSELLHQLVDALVSEGRRAFIAYTPLGAAWATPAEYQRYRCPVASQVPDEPGAAVVVPEVSTSMLSGFRRARHVIWWLSVDNYRGALGTPAGWKFMLRRVLFSDIPAPRAAAHLFQSAYAREYVQRRFKVGGAMLSDYLAPEYFSAPRAGSRRNAVAFNPKKGYGYTARLIQACPDIEFVRLEGMTRQQLRDALDSCSVYIDFGVHPGKDRIPREAAVRGAVVIVARSGAAKSPEDVRLEDCYKFAPSSSSLAAVARLIRDVFENYGRHHEAQAAYRRAIAGEAELFRRQVRHVFGVRSVAVDR